MTPHLGIYGEKYVLTLAPACMYPSRNAALYQIKLSHHDRHCGFYRKHTTEAIDRKYRLTASNSPLHYFVATLYTSQAKVCGHPNGTMYHLSPEVLEYRAMCHFSRIVVMIIYFFWGLMNGVVPASIRSIEYRASLSSNRIGFNARYFIFHTERRNFLQSSD